MINTINSREYYPLIVASYCVKGIRLSKKTWALLERIKKSVKWEGMPKRGRCHKKGRSSKLIYERT